MKNQLDESNFRIENPYTVKNGEVRMKIVKRVIIDGKYEYDVLPDTVIFNECHLPSIAQAKSVTFNHGYVMVNGLPHHLRAGLRKKHEHSASLYLHTVILGKQSPHRMQASHEDGNRLNCRDSNLRFRTIVENSRNKLNPVNKTGFSYVGAKANGTFKISIPVYEQDKYIGQIRQHGFKSARIAAKHADGVQRWLGYDLQCAQNFYGRELPKKVIDTCKSIVQTWRANYGA